ncbi:MAG: thermostable hemolysin [Alcanivorax sp.]|uniref:Thermostable hemolysin n=1 Tax=Alloalcanivorax marinus TaxID=1177169 RepID=A0A9Q3YQ20_9GAMM|nr:thermostable hemolysin [Alloalcanivorax marinus]MBM7335463.1 thermostable hemolysin [Alloalcanivorax marinus]MCC4307188.1 thermostable hemolysin [Alloalcanivorax marinus]
MTPAVFDPVCLRRPLMLQGVPLEARLCRPGEPGYHDAAAFARRRYRASYGARPRITAPTLMALNDPFGQPRAVAALTPAAGRRLFLEQYLDTPLEEAVSALAGTPVARHRLLEVASLAADGSGAGRLLFIALTALLPSLGVDWIAFTATVQVRNMFARLGLAPVCLAPADPARLRGDAGRWGDYYRHDPRVMAGYVPPGHHVLSRAGWLHPAPGYGDPEVRHDVVA